MPTIQISPTPDAVATAAAHQFVDLAQDAIEERGRFTVALSGGSTPKLLYHLLAQEPFRTQIEWQNVYLFWGDERYVPHDHPDSNYRMVCETLLDHVSLPTEHVFPVPTDQDPADAEATYTKYLTDTFGDAPTYSFDLVLLGMGDDGHTASLFPGTDVIDARQWVKVYEVDEAHGRRMTLTPTILNLARQVTVLVTGAGKAQRLAKVLGGERDPHRLPIQSIQPKTGEIMWFLDEAAATEIKA